MASSQKTSAAAGYLLAAALAAFTSCSSPGASSGEPSASSAPSPESPSESAETPTGDTTSEPATLEAAWTKAREWKRGDQDSFGLATDEHVMLWPSPTGPATASVQSMDGDVVLEHPMINPTWIIQDGYLSGDFAVYVNVEPEALRVSVSIYRVSTGKQVNTSTAGRGFFGPETDVNESRLAYALGRPQSGMCLHVLDLESGQDTRVVCEKKGAQLGDLALAGGTLAYSLLESKAGGGRCKSVQFVEVGVRGPAKHDVEAESAAEESAPCANWSTAPMTTGVLGWDNADPELGLTSAQIFAIDNGKVTDLGSGYTDSVRACGEWLFWTRPGAQQFSEILGWRPGMTQPTPIRPEELNVELTTPYCADDRWLTTRADNISGKNETLALWTLDTEQLR